MSVAAAVTIAYFINRYSTSIYPVKASIIILQNDENAGADFLYDNALVNPFRNFYNEIFIMKSYPLLKGVMEELNFDVSYFREGNIKTTEYYDPNFPVEFKILGPQKPYGRSVNFKIKDEKTFSLELLFGDSHIKTKKFENLRFGDTVKINGFSFLVRARGDMAELRNNSFLVTFNDPFALART